jgi:diaminopimelate epimerase
MTRWPPRPSLSPAFYKAHGLGNDYLVFEEGDGWWASDENVRLVCDRTRGVGADGIVVIGADRAEEAGRAVVIGAEAATGQTRTRVDLRMFNPDGGEFERSGNGLRVLGSFLARANPALRAIDVTVGGDRVALTIHGRSGPVHDLSVEMGRAVTGPEVVGLDPLALEASGHAPLARIVGPSGAVLDVVPVSVGNPHLVVVCGSGSSCQVTEEDLASVGPFLTGHPALAHGANVQLAEFLEGRRCRALIWERGVGRTTASGTSACAVAVAMVTAGHVEAGSRAQVGARPPGPVEAGSPGNVSEAGPVEVEMPGGTLAVDVSADLDVVLRGPVEEVFEGRLSQALVAHLSRV